MAIRIFKNARILIVDDEERNVALLRRVLEHAGFSRIESTNDPREVADIYVRMRPDLILLDLNLPRKDGREVLAEVKSDEDLKRIPVVILTTSSADEDILRSYNLHANCYITKPIDLGQFLKVVKSIEDFWLCIVKLPSRR
jgi:CheY-like chemotaxis protein